LKKLFKITLSKVPQKIAEKHHEKIAEKHHDRQPIAQSPEIASITEIRLSASTGRSLAFGSHEFRVIFGPRAHRSLHHSFVGDGHRRPMEDRASTRSLHLFSPVNFSLSNSRFLSLNRSPFPSVNLSLSLSLFEEPRKKKGGNKNEREGIV
jgi:hypothetical protein